jgi:hypothetical protein
MPTKVLSLSTGRSVDFAPKSGRATNLHGDTIDFGRFVIEEGTLISRGGSIRAQETDTGSFAGLPTVREEGRAGLFL